MTPMQSRLYGVTYFHERKRQLILTAKWVGSILRYRKAPFLRVCLSGVYKTCYDTENGSLQLFSSVAEGKSRCFILIRHTVRKAGPSSGWPQRFRDE